MRARLALALLALVATTVLAEPVADEPFDFLDYLGLMVEQDGEWLDPVAMDIESDIEQVSTNDDETASEQVVEEYEDE